MILVIAAMQSEVEILQSHLQLKSSHPFKVYEGTYQDKELLLVISGVGKTNASSALSHMLTLYPAIRQVINLGIVGGHKVGLYDTFIVSEATYHDVDLTVFNYDYGQIPKYPTIYYTDMQLLNKFNNFKHVRLYTGDVFSTKPILDAPYIVDMEGASIFQVCHNFKYPVISIKVVSDVLGDSHQIDTYKKSEAALADQLLEALDIVLEVL